MKIFILIFILGILQSQDCDAGFEMIDEFCYASTDIEFLKNLKNLNDVDIENILMVGQQTWLEGRLIHFWIGDWPLGHDIQIQIIPNSINQLNALERLVIQWNPLTSLPHEICELNQLNELGLDRNQLTELPSCIGNLDQLINLSAVDNNLRSIPPAIDGLVNMLHLNLSDNQLMFIPSEIGNLTQLETLNLRNNRLTVLPLEISQLSSLISLVAENNQLMELPNGFGQLTSLQYLHLDHNFIFSFTDDFWNLDNLTMAYLDDNQFTSVPDNIFELDNLGSLTMNHNKISELPQDICSISEGNVYLSFSQNKICPPYPDCLSESAYSNQDVSECIDFLLEDINLDHTVDIHDIQELMNMIFNPDTYQSNSNPDINHDGVINLLDINLVIQYILNG